MEDMYRTPFERFEKYSPYGEPAEIADFLAAYVEAGCRFFNFDGGRSIHGGNAVVCAPFLEDELRELVRPAAGG